MASLPALAAGKFVIAGVHHSSPSSNSSSWPTSSSRCSVSTAGAASPGFDHAGGLCPLAHRAHRGSATRRRAIRHRHRRARPSQPACRSIGSSSRCGETNHLVPAALPRASVPFPHWDQSHRRTDDWTAEAHRATPPARRFWRPSRRAGRRPSGHHRGLPSRRDYRPDPTVTTSSAGTAASTAALGRPADLPLASTAKIGPPHQHSV